MKRQKRSPIPERTESEMVHFAQALPGINVKLWICLWNAVSISETRHHMKYSIILPVMKSLSWLPHVVLTWLSGKIYGSRSPFHTLPEEMSKNLLIIPKVLRPQQNIWRLSFQFSRAIISFLFILPYFKKQTNKNSWLTFLL